MSETEAATVILMEAHNMSREELHAKRQPLTPAGKTLVNLYQGLEKVGAVEKGKAQKVKEHLELCNDVAGTA